MDGREYTVDQFVREYKDEEVTFRTLHYQEFMEAENRPPIILNSDSLITKYFTELSSHIVTLKASDEEIRKYKYNPKLLSFDLYGTTEYWFLILEANEISSVTEFDQFPCKVYDGRLPQLINSIINLERPYVDENRAELTEKIKSAIEQMESKSS